MSAKVSQGVTTVVVGNCGVSLAPFVATERPPPPLDLLGVDWFRFPTFAAYLDEVDAKPAAANAVFLIGHQTLRVRERSEEHTSELQSLMRISYAVFCLKKKKTQQTNKLNAKVIQQSIHKKTIIHLHKIHVDNEKRDNTYLQGYKL